MSCARILIVDDDVGLSDQLAALLRERGFEIAQCHDGEQGLLTALASKFDLILLDVLLPKLGGFSLLNQLRKVRQTPVMMLTACGAEEARIEGYSKGADDYLPKPFNIDEMLLRIEALLRRARWGSESQRHLLALGELTLDRHQMSAFFQQQPVLLTPIQFRLLWVLAENAGEVLSKPLLSQAVLEKPFSRYDRSLDMHMSRVRRKLVEVGMAAERLSTVHGKGYLLQ